MKVLNIMKLFRKKYRQIMTLWYDLQDTESTTLKPKENTIYLKCKLLPNKNKQNKKVKKKLPTGRRLLQHVTNSREYTNNSYKQSEKDTQAAQSHKALFLMLLLQGAGEEASKSHRRANHLAIYSGQRQGSRPSHTC